MSIAHVQQGTCIENISYIGVDMLNTQLHTLCTVGLLIAINKVNAHLDLNLTIAAKTCEFTLFRCNFMLSQLKPKSFLLMA